MKQHSSMWITKCAAAAALVVALGGTARATILSAGPFLDPNTGIASCAVTNTGSSPVTVYSITMLAYTGSVLHQTTNVVVEPGKSFFGEASFLSFEDPSACVFDVSTTRGVHAGLTFSNGTAVAVIPATK